MLFGFWCPNNNWTRSGWKKLTRKQRYLLLLLTVLCVIVYFILMPSAPMFFDPSLHPYTEIDSCVITPQTTNSHAPPPSRVEQYTAWSDITITILAAPAILSQSITYDPCPLVPAFEIASIQIDLNPSEESMSRLSEDDSHGGKPVLVGGAWRPLHCLSRHRVAIVVPYRNRPIQLAVFLHHMHQFLRRQLLDYRIIIVEQNDGNPFNRAALLNIGFVEALKLYSFHCFIFHDVDLLPEKLENMYVCTKSPRHMSVAINTMRYNLPYLWIFGGATSMTVDQFKLVNGYSNYFFGWGGEDDDMSNRITRKGLTIMRWDPKISSYFMLPHAKEPPSPNRFTLFKRGSEHYEDNGLNSVNYKLPSVVEHKLYTLVSVQLNNTGFL